MDPALLMTLIYQVTFFVSSHFLRISVASNVNLNYRPHISANIEDIDTKLYIYDPLGLPSISLSSKSSVRNPKHHPSTHMKEKDPPFPDTLPIKISVQNFQDMTFVAYEVNLLCQR